MDGIFMGALREVVLRAGRLTARGGLGSAGFTVLDLAVMRRGVLAAALADELGLAAAVRRAGEAAAALVRVDVFFGFIGFFLVKK
jgi:hypothetical protein